MSRIAGKETKPEILVRKYLFACGFRYRKNVKNLPGKPDIVLKKYKTAIFVHGCFWHGHPGCAKSALPASNRAFWEKKIGLNIARDQKNKELLSKAGWKIITIWQCEISNAAKLKNTLEKTITRLKANTPPQ